MLHVWIDQDLCTGDGLCTDHCPELFVLLEDGISYVQRTARHRTIPEGPVRWPRWRPTRSRRRWPPPRTVPASASSWRRSWTQPAVDASAATPSGVRLEGRGQS